MILRRAIRGWQRATVTVRLCARSLKRTGLWWTTTVTQRAGTVTRSRTRRHSIASTSFENPIPLTVGCRMVIVHDAQPDPPRLPDESTGLLSAAHRTV